MFHVTGGKKYKKKGGCNSVPSLSPAPFDGVGSIATGGDANTKFNPTLYGSKQVGGDGYGYTNGSEAAKVNSSYFPITRNVAGGYDSNRGGNNPMMGGKRSKKRSVSKRRSSTRRSKRTSKKSKRSSKQKRYRQKGCSRKMKGGLIIL